MTPLTACVSEAPVPPDDNIPDRRAVVIEPLDRGREVHAPAGRFDCCCDGFPHLSGPEPRVMELANQGARLSATQQCVRDGAREREIREILLRGPVGAYDVAGQAPDLLRVALEERPVEPIAESVRDPGLEAFFRVN